MSAVRESRLAAAAVIGGAVVAGAFLWSRRSEITDRIGNFADQINQLRDGLPSKIGIGGQTASSDDAVRDEGSSKGRRSQREIAEEALTLKQMGEPA